MDIFIYSDESGVFDKAHNDFFVFGGIICLGKDNKDIYARKYSKAEKTIRKNRAFAKHVELKASVLSNTDKGKLFRSLNQFYKFGVIIHQQKLMNSIFSSKKDKQRYLDFAYKIAVKHAFEEMIKENIISVNAVENLSFFIDEHTTATNGIYELREALEAELKRGTHNWNYNKFFPPLFENIKNVNLQYCNSKVQYLIRASDIVANKLYYLALQDDKENLKNIPNLFLKHLP